MRDALPELTPAEMAPPRAVTAALWIGWAYQLMTLGAFFLFYIPRKQAYLDSFKQGRKMDRLLTQDEVNMVLHPDATMFGEVAAFTLVFIVSAYLLKQTSHGLAWARVALAVWSVLRLVFSFMASSNGSMLFDLVPQITMVVLLFLPSSRRWFSPRAPGVSEGMKA